MQWHGDHLFSNEDGELVVVVVMMMLNLELYRACLRRGRGLGYLDISKGKAGTGEARGGFLLPRGLDPSPLPPFPSSRLKA